MILFYNFLAVLFFCLLFLFSAKKYDKTEKIIYIKLGIYILITIFVLTLILLNNLISYENFAN